MNEKFAQLEKIFPECFTEKNFNGELKKVIDFDLLKDILSENISDSPESYNFSWVGKNFARAEAYKPTDKTLRPCIEESENFFTTENLYIEGDNLEVLKLLQQSYYQKVKMIYIDKRQAYLIQANGKEKSSQSLRIWACEDLRNYGMVA